MKENQNISIALRELADWLSVNSGDADAIARLMEESGIVDGRYYLEKYPDVRNAGMQPAIHYFQHGYKEGRCPAAAFEPLIQDKELLPLIMAEDADPFRGHIRKLLLASTILEQRQDSKIIRQGTYASLYDMPLWVDWLLTTMCNYKCSYCFGQERIDKRKFVPLHKLIIAIDNLASLNRPYYDIGLIGGEPTVYPQIIDLLYAISSKLGPRLNNLYLVSNGSRNMGFFRDLHELAGMAPVSLVFSIHTEQCDPDHIYELASSLTDRIRISFLLMFQPERWQLVKEIHTTLLKLRNDHFFNLDISLLREPPAFNGLDSRYTQEMLDWRELKQAEFDAAAAQSGLRAPGPSMRGCEWFADLWTPGGMMNIRGGNRNSNYRKGYFNLKDLFCVLGAHKIRITDTGELYGAVCVQGKLPGNMFEPGCLADPGYIRHIKCEQPNCSCNSNDVCMKFRDPGEADRFVSACRSRQERLYLK